MNQTLTAATHFVALHGFTGEGADFSALSSFTGGTWHCPDLPGHGTQKNAPTPDFSLPHLKSRIFENIDTTQHIGVGYSMGGRLLLNLATQQPHSFQALVLISTSPGLPSSRERKARICSDLFWIDLLRSEGLENFLTKWWDQPILASIRNLPPEDYQRILARRLQNSTEGLIKSLELHGTGVLPSCWELLQNLDLPVLICTGTNDTKFQQISEKMHYLLPRSQQIQIPGASHSPHIENPAKTAQAISDFLSKNGLA